MGGASSADVKPDDETSKARQKGGSGSVSPGSPPPPPPPRLSKFDDVASATGGYCDSGGSPNGLGGGCPWGVSSTGVGARGLTPPYLTPPAGLSLGPGSPLFGGGVGLVAPQSCGGQNTILSQPLQSCGSKDRAEHVIDIQGELQKRSAQIHHLSQQIQVVEVEYRELQQRGSSRMSGDNSLLPTSKTPLPSEGVEAFETVKTLKLARRALSNMREELEGSSDKFEKAVQVAKSLDSWFVDNASKMNIKDIGATPSAFLLRLLESCQQRSATLVAAIVDAEAAAAGAAEPSNQSASSAMSFSQGSLSQATLVEHSAANQTQHQAAQREPGSCERGHPLNPFFTSAENFRCNNCNAFQAMGNQMFGCRLCDYDMCWVCMTAPGWTSQPVVGKATKAASSIGIGAPLKVPGRRGCGVTPAAAKPGGTGVKGLWVRDPDEDSARHAAS